MHETTYGGAMPLPDHDCDVPPLDLNPIPMAIRHFPCIHSPCAHLGILHGAEGCFVSGCGCEAFQPWAPPAPLPDHTDEERARVATLGQGGGA